MTTHVAHIASAANCLKQADAAAQLAADTALPNVRERHLAAERVWREMAARADQIQIAAEIRDTAKLERNA